MAWFETNGIRVARVGVDCADVDVMVRFWSRALGYEVTRFGDSSALLHHPASAGPKLYLRKGPSQGRERGRDRGRERGRDRERDRSRNRLQLDLYAVDADRVIGWLSSRGAQRVGRYDDDDGTGFVLIDPEGNEFRVLSAGPDGFSRPFA